MHQGWVERSPHWASVVEAFHRYQVRGRIGAGGMAEIFLAEEKEPPHRRVALKRLLGGNAEHEELRAMFVDEARLGMRLTHPSLCRVYDVGMLEGDLVIAMEHIDGVTLADLIDRCPEGLPIPAALSIIADVAGALDSVHRARDEHGRPLGIVHRDVTPKNVMIGFDGRVKLLDFGLAKSELNESITRPGMAKGKFAYLAPELWSEGRPDARADVFSLGVCLFEALTGTRLYHHASPFDSKRAIVEGPVPSVLDHRERAPRALDHIVRRCLAKRPEARFESAGALHTALVELLPAMGMQPERADRLVCERFREERERGPVLVPTRFGARASSRPPPRDETPSVPPPVLMPAAPRMRRRAWVGGGGIALGLALGLALLFAARDDASESTEVPLSHRAPSAIEAAPRVAAIAAGVEPRHERAVRVEGESLAGAARESAERVRLERRRAPVALGALSVNTRPWSEVLVDGRSLGTTPIAEVTVGAGRHQLTFIDRDGNEHHATIDVTAGVEARVFRDFAPQAADSARAEAVAAAPDPS